MTYQPTKEAEIHADPDEDGPPVIRGTTHKDAVVEADGPEKPGPGGPWKPPL